MFQTNSQPDLKNMLMFYRLRTCIKKKSQNKMEKKITKHVTLRLLQIKLLTCFIIELAFAFLQKIFMDTCTF